MPTAADFSANRAAMLYLFTAVSSPKHAGSRHWKDVGVVSQDMLSREYCIFEPYLSPPAPPPPPRGCHQYKMFKEVFNKAEHDVLVN